MNFIKYALILLWAWVLSASALAQDPNWVVTPSEYQYSMTLVAFLTVDGITLTGEQDQVAAIVNGETRGVTNPIYVAGADRYLAYLTIYANKEEQVEFKIYNSSGNNVVAIDTTIGFKIDAQYGNVFQALSLANPVLSNLAEISNFFFTGVDSVATNITEGLIDIVLEYDQDLTSLNHEFTISNGAKMFIDRTLQESGAGPSDFSESIVYSVVSEDESVLNHYEVMVRNRETIGNESDFVSTNVITANNDGNNDYWIVQDAFKYASHNFKILDANGRILFESTGYKNDWDGNYRGHKIERGTYYFVITDMETNKAIKGDILVLY
jgi:gliding motility-associated-like protein